MTREQAKELLPVIEAFAEGKTVQFYNNIRKKWTDVTTPLFERVVTEPFGDNDKYRIKPEPREFWILMPSDKPGGVRHTSVFNNKEQAIDAQQYSIRHGFEREIVHTKEFQTEPC